MHLYVIYINDGWRGNSEIALYRARGSMSHDAWTRRTGEKEDRWWGAYISKTTYDELRVLQKAKNLNILNVYDILKKAEERPYVIAYDGSRQEAYV
jgi:hypothetical protein